MKIQFASNWVCRFEPPIEKRKIMEKQLLPSELLSERSYTMVAIRMTWVISILLLSLHCLLAEADDRIEVKTPVEVLSETLVSLNLANPSADLEANLSKGDRRFIGINGYTCTTPGANNKEYSLVHSAQYGLRCLAGTSDNIESEHHKALIEEATDYARKYNTELLRADSYWENLTRFAAGIPEGPNNVYAYVNANPLSSIDPLGLAAYLNKINATTADQIALAAWADSYRPPQYNTIVVHGGPDGSYSPNANRVGTISPEELARELLSEPGYDPTLPTQLIACSAGAHPYSVQALANALNATVLASPQILSSSSPGQPPWAKVDIDPGPLSFNYTLYVSPVWVPFIPH